MRLLANLIVALALVWPAPLAMPAAFAAQHAGSMQASQSDPLDHSGHSSVAPEPAQHDGSHMPDCCIGTACFGLGVVDAVVVTIEATDVRLVAGKAIHLVAVTRRPELPPPRL